MAELILSPEAQRERAMRIQAFNMGFDMRWQLFQQLLVVDYQNARADQRRETKEGKKPAALKFDASVAARAAHYAVDAFMKMNVPADPTKDEVKKTAEEAASESKPADAAPAPEASPAEPQPEAAAAAGSGLILP